MRLLISGGAGYIGHAVTHQLIRAGHQVTIVDNLSTGNSGTLPSEATFYRGNIGDRGLLDELLPEVDAVVHLAASIEVGESMKNPSSHFRNNTVQTLELADAMIAHGVSKLVFSSTAAVYGDPDQVPVTESHPLRPLNPYGESKKMVEQALRWLSECNDLRVASLRYFNAAGGTTSRKATNLIPIVLEVAAGRRPYLEVFGTDYNTRDGTAIRDYVHVKDLARAHHLALEALDVQKQIVFNLGTGLGSTVLEVVEAARRVTGHPIPIKTAARRCGDPAEVTASYDRIKSEIGWKPMFSDLESIIESSWIAFQTEPNWKENASF